MKKVRKRAMRNSRGVTLVELLVAIIVLSIAILVIISVIAKGRELQVSDSHRRQARSIIDSLMEAKYDDRDYLLITDTTVVSSSLLDSGFTATITENVSSNTANVSGYAVPVKQVNVSVRWNEAEGADSISIQKMITGVRQKF